MTPDELMLAAKNKFDTMKEKGIWNAPTAEEKIIALEAKFDSTVKSLNKKVSFERKKGSGSGKNKTTEKSGGKKDGKSKKDGDHPKKWQAPKSGDKKEAVYKGHIWYWCGKETGGKCEKWRAHKPKEYKGIAESGTKRDGETSKKGDKKHLAKKLKVAKAYIARIEKQAAEADMALSTDSDDE